MSLNLTCSCDVDLSMTFASAIRYRRTDGRVSYFVNKIQFTEDDVLIKKNLLLLHFEWNELVCHNQHVAQAQMTKGGLMFFFDEFQFIQFFCWMPKIHRRKEYLCTL